MKYFIEWNSEKSTELEVPSLRENKSSSIEFEGKVYEVQVQNIGENQVSLTIDGNPYDLETIPTPGEANSVRLAFKQRHYFLNIENEITALLNAQSEEEKASGPIELISSLPGSVRQVFRNVGDVVQKGEPILTLEAMKMENEIISEIDGTVDQIFVEPGQVVAAREKLGRIVPME